MCCVCVFVCVCMCVCVKAYGEHALCHARTNVPNIMIKTWGWGGGGGGGGGGGWRGQG